MEYAVIFLILIADALMKYGDYRVAMEEEEDREMYESFEG
jgi:hypothetical protein